MWVMGVGLTGSAVRSFFLHHSHSHLCLSVRCQYVEDREDVKLQWHPEMFSFSCSKLFLPFSWWKQTNEPINFKCDVWVVSRCQAVFYIRFMYDIILEETHIHSVFHQYCAHGVSVGFLSGRRWAEVYSVSSCSVAWWLFVYDSDLIRNLAN